MAGRTVAIFVEEAERLPELLDLFLGQRLLHLLHPPSLPPRSQLFFNPPLIDRSIGLFSPVGDAS